MISGSATVKVPTLQGQKVSKGVEAAVGLSYAPPTTIFILDDGDLTR